MSKTVLSTLWAMAGAAVLSAAPIEFDFKDPKGVNNVVFRMDAPLESINGTGTGISGKVTFDPQHPDQIEGTIRLDVKTLNVPNPMMKDHMLGPDWMNAGEHGDIVFQIVDLKNVKTQGNTTSADAVGKMTIKGKTREMTVPVKITYLKDRLKDRQGKEGDLLVIRSNFEIKRSEFGINAGQNEDKVADTIELSLSIAGSAPRS